MSQKENNRSDISRRNCLLENHTDKKTKCDYSHRIEEEENPDKKKVAVGKKCCAGDNLEVDKHRY